MPPKTNHKRAKLSKKATGKATPILIDPSESNVSKQQDSSFSNAESKAFELPLELLMEIISYFKGIPDPSKEYHHYGGNGGSDKLERTDALRALSQTCKRWRYIFLPLLYERLDVCATHSQSGAWYQVYGEALIRKSFLVTENREIASHVRSISVILSRYSPSTVLPAFVRAIEALPNLKVLNIVSAHHKMTTALKNAFDGHVFPQVQTIALPTYAHNILRSCPSVRKIICNDGQDASKLISAISKECKHVEEIDGFSFYQERSMKRLVKAVPNLHSIKFRRTFPASILEPLRATKNICHITIQTDCPKFEEVSGSPLDIPLIKLAKEIVKNSKLSGPKSVVLSFHPYNKYYYPNPMPEPWSRTLDL